MSARRRSGDFEGCVRTGALVQPHLAAVSPHAVSQCVVLPPRRAQPTLTIHPCVLRTRGSLPALSVLSAPRPAHSWDLSHVPDEDELWDRGAYEGDPLSAEAGVDHSGDHSVAARLYLPIQPRRRFVFLAAVSSLSRGPHMMTPCYRR